MYRVMQNAQPDIHIIGHWTYPADTKKTVYVVANTATAVELFVNGKSLGKSATPTTATSSPSPTSRGPRARSRPSATRPRAPPSRTDEIENRRPAGGAQADAAPSDPTGLQADGADVALVRRRSRRRHGRRCPTDEARVDFTLTGPGIWRGGYNSGIVESTNNLYLNTEAASTACPFVRR